MQTACPVYCDVAFVAIEPCSALHTAPRTNTTKLKQAIEDRTIISDVVLALFFRILVHVIGCDFGQEIDVFIRMELRHFVLGRRFGALQSRGC